MDEAYNDTPSLTPEERAERRAKRIAARQAREKARRIAFLKRSVPVLLLLIAAVGGLIFLFTREDGAARADDNTPVSSSVPMADLLPAEPASPEEPEPFPLVTETTAALGSSVDSQYAVLIDLSSGEVLAQKAADTMIYPASMTKVLTVLTASRALAGRDYSQDTETIDLSITDYCYSNGCSVAGFEKDEKVPIQDLFYGTILPSGAEAAVALARYAGGSHEKFVDMMNETARELGVSEGAHFTNCVGIYDDNNVCTVKDMAIILKAAIEDPLCREVLSTRIYYPQPTEVHPEGMDPLSNWFIRRIEEKDSGSATVLGGKTGYVHQSGSCAASFAEGPDGTLYICVTGDASSKWTCIQDHADLYRTYIQ